MRVNTSKTGSAGGGRRLTSEKAISTVAKAKKKAETKRTVSKVGKTNPRGNAGRSTKKK